MIGKLPKQLPVEDLIARKTSHKDENLVTISKLQNWGLKDVMIVKDPFL